MLMICCSMCSCNFICYCGAGVEEEGGGMNTTADELDTTYKIYENDAASGRSRSSDVVMKVTDNTITENK